MKKLYDTLWDKNASMAMAAIVGRGDVPNYWEVATMAYDIADAMASIRARRVKEDTVLLNEQTVTPMSLAEVLDLPR